jgi:hypothetical protein
LRWPNRLLKGLQVDGKPSTPDRVREALMDELAKGHELVPFGEPCEGFDYKSGCPGHPIDDAAAPSEAPHGK